MIAELTDEEFLDLELTVMDLILQKMQKDGKMVFSEVENGLLN